MTEAERLKYVTLLLSGREDEAAAFREDCDAHWAAHPAEWDAVRIPDGAPQPL